MIYDSLLAATATMRRQMAADNLCDEDIFGSVPLQIGFGSSLKPEDEENKWSFLLFDYFLQS